MEKTKKDEETAPMGAVGCTLDGGQEAQTKLPAERRKTNVEVRNDRRQDA